MDRIDLVRVFGRVVECENFTRAADLRGMPRSSVSSAIQELEGRVATRLLHRTTRCVTPTLDGAALYARCVRLLEDVAETENLFRQTTTALSGTLRIDVPGRIGRLVIAPALPAFLESHPQISIYLGMSDRAVNLIAEQVDCVLRVGTLSDSGLVAREIGTLPLINVASPAYLARYGTPRTPTELAHHEAINYASPSSGRIAPWEWVEGTSVKTLALRGRTTVNNAEAYIAACLAGLGLIQIPAYDVAAHLRLGELVEVMPDHRAEPMPMTLLYPHRQHLPRRLQVFVDWLDALLRRHVLGDPL